jgi:hypothetical protein
MAPSDLDIYRSATVLIEQYGENATIFAAKHADQLLADGDIQGQAVWKRILRATEELQRREPDGAVH